MAPRQCEIVFFAPADTVPLLVVGHTRLPSTSGPVDELIFGLAHSCFPPYTKFLPALSQKGILESTYDMLRQVSGDQLGHLEHGDGTLAAENLLKLLVGVDVALVLRILEIVLLDVGPEFLYDLGARHRTLADHFSQLRTDVHRLHKSGI